jgi:hypothetical protein
MTGRSSTPPSEPQPLPEIDKTPGQLIFASLVCFFGGAFIAVLSVLLAMIFRNEAILGLAVLMWPLWFISKMLVIATIVACFHKKPGYR